MEDEKLYTLSVVIPVFNEEKTICDILNKIKSVDIPSVNLKLVIVNDCSSDNSEQVVYEYIENNQDVSIKYFKHEVNMGKGAALHTGIANADGDFLIIQDADLEYDPQEYKDMLKPMLNGNADVVYGSRFMGSNPHRILFFWHTLGNKFLTRLSNIFTNLNLTDMESCYKLFKTDIIQQLKLEEKRFGFEPEVTAKISRVPKIRIYEIGISYYGRTYDEGKKIGWKDGFRAIYCILKYNIWKR